MSTHKANNNARSNKSDIIDNQPKQKIEMEFEEYVSCFDKKLDNL